MGSTASSAGNGVNRGLLLDTVITKLRDRQTLMGIAPLLGLIALSTVFTLINPRFISPMNLTNILRQSAIPLVLVIGETFVILTGSIDLSVEGVMALSGISVSLLILNDKNAFDFGLWAVPVGLAAGLLMGCLNGVVHVKARIPSFIGTIGTWFIGLGAAVILYKGYTFPLHDETFLSLYLGRTAGIPNCVIIAAVLLIIAWIVQNHTRFGRYLYAIGGGEDLAEMSGINVSRYKLLTFAVAGLFFGAGGVLNAARLGQGTAVVGPFLFSSIAAVVVGGTSLGGGSGGILQSLIGILFVTAVANGMILIGLHPFTQLAVQGLIFIVAVLLTLDRSKISVLK